VPDLYQGTELWSLHLVDPDNRRPVDYDERRHALAEVKWLTPSTILERADEGLPKMWVIHSALQVRCRHPEAFGLRSSYRAVMAQGPRADHVVAFRRADDVMTVVPRLVIRAAGRWCGTTVQLPAGTWHNVLSDRRVPAGEVDLADLWHDFPVALLERINH
jgi:(1->4)-alpha-D-glucan 1-alpha-D-glucosylmutase